MTTSTSPRQLSRLSAIRPEDLLDRPSIYLNQETALRSLRGRVVLITGAAGSIGSELTRQLLAARPAGLVLLDQAESALFELIDEVKYQTDSSETEVLAQVAGVTDERRMRELFSRYRPELVFHAAAYKHVALMENNPSEALRVNVQGTQILADLSMEAGVDKFMLISTDKAVNPTTVMGATKSLAERYIQSLHGLDRSTRFIITRFGNVLGSSGSVVRIFQKQIRRGGPVTVTHPEVTRYFITPSEAGQLVLAAGAAGLGGELFSFDMGEPVRIDRLARKMIRLAGLSDEKDIRIVYTGLGAGEKLHEELWNEQESFSSAYHPKIRVGRFQEVAPKEGQSMIQEVRRVLAEAEGSVLKMWIKQITVGLKQEIT